MILDKPGIYRGVAVNDYHADPCPEASLSQSIAKILIDKSPKHAWIAHPRLNPNFEPDDDKKFDLGNVTHSLILGRGKDFQILPFDDYRTKAAQQARDAALDEGKVAILHEQFTRAVIMAAEFRDQIGHHEDADAFSDVNGSKEVMVCWQEDGIWFRSLVDYLSDNLCTVDDYKSTGFSVAPHAIGSLAANAGWHIQAAFIERGLNVLDPDNMGRRKFRFIAQETEAPHALTVMHMDEHWMTMGRKQVNAAIGLWTRCIRSDRWPSYPTRGVTPEFPGWKESQWMDREVSEFDPKVLMAG